MKLALGRFKMAEKSVELIRRIVDLSNLVSLRDLIRLNRIFFVSFDD